MTSERMMVPDVLLSLNNVSKQFDGKTVLQGLTMQLLPGMVVGLLGANGAGKSTLMRIALGIVKADSGTVQILGDEPQQLSSAAKNRIGYVPQQSFGYEGFSVGKALEWHRSFYDNWDVTLEQEWLTRFQLDRSTAVQKLSIGQRQSLALIMAMAYRPQLLLLDEPVASLDPVARRSFMADLFDLALESGSAVLFSSHITSDLERVASHVALLKQGELILFRELDALREQLRVLQFADGEAPVLPVNVQLLARHGNRWLVDGDLSHLHPAGLLTSQPLNLEQLFLELHS
ncbi:ABC transporter ATP-binding protein [Shewanella sp. 4t3-1-2LB]|uniref:ABC transporter ATP-binding protein n=1 Tax=Shewanella sp. 4t3-1-2LB TaxID=2817682 RepID=UPI001F618F69|nr:ABC transporter ATP-binding protein [Shewanella sp. 4t3-1-2LB]